MMEHTHARDRTRSTETNRDRGPIAVLLQEPRGHGVNVPPSANPPCPRGRIEPASPADGIEIVNESITIGEAPLPAARVQALSDAAVEVNSQIEEDGLLNSIVSQAVKLLEASSGAFYLYDPDRNALEARAWAGYGRRDLECLTGFAHTVTHTSEHAVVKLCRDPAREGSSAWMAGVAVHWDDQLLAVLVVSAPSYFTPADARLLGLFAVHAATALRNARVVHSLRDLNELKDAAIGLAAHDLKGPLTHMAGYVGLLSEGLGPLDARRAKWLGIVEQSIERMGQLIDGILNYRRLSLAEKASQKPCDLSELAATAAAHSEKAVSEKGQTLDVETWRGRLPVVGDDALLREAILNLLSNAIKYTPSGGRVRVRTERAESDCRVTVEDTGPGIAPEDQDKIFRPFVRLPDARSKDGLGLGLSLVKTIVERHGGRISVESRVGEGASFSLHLPGAYEARG